LPEISLQLTDTSALYDWHGSDYWEREKQSNILFAFIITEIRSWHLAYNISNIGLFNSSSTGTLFAGNTYASSSCASNQAVNITYDITFS
jgi:hypothetical protein